MRDEPVISLPEPIAGWFAARGWAPRPHQLALVEAARAGASSLLIAPTGAGKTLAGFLPSLIALNGEVHAWQASGAPATARPHTLHTLYISPLKALTQDVARNLMGPAEEMGLGLRIETRTGDTPPAKRQRQRAKPPDILLTTPEQVALFIAQENGAAFFGDLQAIIIDEAHALAASKRGDLLSLGLAAIHRLAPKARRVGLSATVRDEAGLAAWLGVGGAPAQIVRAAPGPPPVVDVLTSQERVPWAGHTGRHAHQEVYERIKAARTALVFVNTRSQAEMTFQGLWSVNDDNLAIALHHGSLAVEQRRKVEAAMTRGALRAVVCTSTLDLGIDWGDVDLVIQMGAPKGSARLVQRIGRANHRYEEASRALLVPSNRFEVLECRAALEAVAQHDLDTESFAAGALDVLCQHIMGRACGDPFEALALFDEIRTAAPYADLAWETFEQALDFVATGGYALRTYDRYRRVVQGQDGRWRARDAGVAQTHRMNVGSIVEDPYLEVRLTAGHRVAGAPTVASPKRQRGAGREARVKQMRAGRKIGQIDEWFVNQLAPGDTFAFAGQILRFEGIQEMTCLVSPSHAREPKTPSWPGGKFPMSTFLARRVRAMIDDPASWDSLPDQVREWLQLQRARSRIPKPDEMLVETFPRGDRFYLAAYPFDGRLAHQTLGMLLTRRLERARLAPLGFVANDYAILVWGLKDMAGLDLDALFDEDMLGDDLDAWLAESALMKRTFRNCALISGLLERRRPGQEKTGRQVTFSTDLIYDVLARHQPDHIILQAAWRDAGSGLLDIARLGAALKRVQGKILHAALDRVSPLSVPAMLEIGREPVYGAASDVLMEEAAQDLIAEATGPEA